MHLLSKSLWKKLGFVIFSTFGDIFLTFHFFGGGGSQPGRNLQIFVPNLYSNLGVKSVLKAKTCASKPSRTELWLKSRVTWQSQNQDGVYMLRMSTAREITVKTARNFHFRTKNSLKWLISESRQRN